MVKIEKTEKQMIVSSPYHPDLPAKAKKLGGKWSATAKAWTFDIRDEDRVKDLYRNIYGTDGDTPTGDLVTLRVNFFEGASDLHGGIFIGGRCIGRATGRDSGASLANGIIIIEGRIYSGGSVKNWRTIAAEGTIVEIRDIPREKALEVIASGQTDSFDTIKAEILEPTTINREALEAEREKLLARITEIEAILAQ